MNLNGLEIKVIRSHRRKTLHIVIERDGTVSVQAPDGLEEERILTILTSKEYEIHKKLLRWKELNKEHIVREFIAGQSFMYMGKNYNLQFVEKQKQVLQLKDGKFLMKQGASHPRNAFIRFYKKQATLKINERIVYYKEMLDVKPGTVIIRDLPTRWASCTPEGNLYFNWKCIMAPSIVLDYLIVHELVHLEHPNHSRAFWDKVASICPSYKEQEMWLERNGVRMIV